MFKPHLSCLKNIGPFEDNFIIMASDKENRKGGQFKDYFLQFLMLFLAIFLGAIGENYRQQYTDEVVERNMEKFIEIIL